MKCTKHPEVDYTKCPCSKRKANSEYNRNNWNCLTLSRFKNTRQNDLLWRTTATKILEERNIDGIFPSVCVTPLPELISCSDGWAHFWYVINCLVCLYFLSLSLSPFLLPFTCFCVLLIYTPLSQCVSLSFTWELEVWNVMWCRADGQQSGVGCVWNRACLPMRGARPYFNPGFSGGAACSRWGHCTAPCINNSRRARESGGVCLPAQ